jgi:hypothetical protein
MSRVDQCVASFGLSVSVLTPMTSSPNLRGTAGGARRANRRDARGQRRLHRRRAGVERKRPGHLCIAESFGTGEHDSTSQGEGLLALWPPFPAFKRVPLVVVELRLNCRSAPSCHDCLPSSPIEGQTRGKTAKSYFRNYCRLGSLGAWVRIGREANNYAESIFYVPFSHFRWMESQSSV